MVTCDQQVWWIERSALDDKMPAKPGNKSIARSRSCGTRSTVPQLRRSQLAFDRRDALRQSPIVTNATALRDAEQYFHQQIPITRAMGVRIVAHDENQFVVEAPVALNSNHLRTAFGGSINAVATLAAYGLLWHGLRDHAVHVVVAESSIRFLRPVRETIRAICLRPDHDEWAAFQTQFEGKGKAHIILRVNVVEEGQAVADFKGTFVVRKNLSQTRAS